MRFRVLAVLLIAVAASLTISLIRGQDRPAPPTILPDTRPTAPALARDPAPAPVAPTIVTPAGAIVPRPARPARDLSHLTPLQQQMLLAAQRGADWLFRMHGVKGRFVPGYQPALKQEMEGDHYLRQAGAACALARAARFTGEERYAVRATQALLSLLDDTVTDAKDPTVRYSAMPPVLVNRLASAAILVEAIGELPAPQKDLLEGAKGLCNFIHKQAQANGELSAPGAAHDEEDVAAAGQALHALLLHHKQNPAGWKVELARKALPYYRGWWKEHKGMTFVPYHAAACCEAYLTTKDKAFADFVFEMVDWLGELQYTRIDAKHMLWYGGFMSWSGRAVETPPTVDSALYAEALVEACRVAREMGDVAHYQRYSEALERCLQFLTTLQYTDAGVQHFSEWYQPRIVGAFHASHQDGNLRIDYTQHAVAALLGYLEHSTAK